MSLTKTEFVDRYEKLIKLGSLMDVNYYANALGLAKTNLADYTTDGWDDEWAETIDSVVKALSEKIYYTDFEHLPQEEIGKRIRKFLEEGSVNCAIFFARALGCVLDDDEKIEKDRAIYIGSTLFMKKIGRFISDPPFS